MQKRGLICGKMKACILALVLVFTLSTSDAHAAAIMDNSCSNLSQYGFTTGLVYCVEKTIGNAVKQYVQKLQTTLGYYEAMAMAVAIALFGMKLMNSNVQEPLKETMTLVMRILIGVFLFTEGVQLYTWATGIMDESLTWLPKLASYSPNCTPPGSPGNFDGYTVWQGFDCMFTTLMGAANPAKNPVAFGTSMIVIVGAALFSGILGIICVILAITAFFAALYMIARAIYLVLLAYICVGFMAIFTPLVAPLIFFNSDHLTKMFKRWAMLIVATMFQPMFVIGFLVMAVTVDDQFIEGQVPGCNAPTYPKPGGGGTEPAQGWGQNGSGVCSFLDLFNPKPRLSGQAYQTWINNFMENNSTVASWTTGGDPQAHSTNGGTISNTWCMVKKAFQKDVHQFLMCAGDFLFGGVTRLKQFAPLKQLALTLLAFAFATYLMFKLMFIVPQMAASITVMVAVNLYSLSKMPFEGLINSAVKGAGEAMKGSMSGAGLAKGNLQGLTRLGSAGKAGVRGGAQSAWDYMKSNY